MPPRKRKSERLQELQKAVETKRGRSATTTYDVDTQPNPSTSSEAVSMAPIATPSQDTGHEPNAATSTPANHTTSQTVPPAIIQAPVRDSAPPLSSGVQSAISHMNNTNGLLERLKNGGTLMVAEGYIFEFERRGYLQAGTFVPEVILEHPELVRQMYEEFVHAGSDVVLALTYYAHREKLKVVGRENDIDAMNTAALKIAREVADEHGALMAGNICNSTIFIADDTESYKKVEEVFKEQIELAVQCGADFIVGETFGHYGEAKIALESIKKYGNGLPAVITYTVPPNAVLCDGIPIVEACRRLEEDGADVVGLNCGRGPATMIPLLKEIKKVCKGPVAALPVTYRTSEEVPTFFNLKVPGTDVKAFPLNLTACLCSRIEITEFAEACKEIGIEYVGLCCGNCSIFTRIVAEVYDKNPPASRYAPNMSKHYIFGDKSPASEYYTSKYKKHITI